MEIKIKNIYLDDNDNIYILDEGNILYYQENEYYIPFTEIMLNISRCQFYSGYFFVHYSGKLKIFDEEMYEVIRPAFLITDNYIDQICFCGDNYFIVMLMNGKIYIYQTDPDELNNNIYDICLNDYSMNDFFVPDGKKFQYIKIVNSMLLTYMDNQMSVFMLDKDLKYICTIQIFIQDYFDIYDSHQNLFLMTGGRSIDNTGKIYDTSDLIFYHKSIFPNNPIEIYQNKLIFNHRNEMDNQILSKLCQIIPLTLIRKKIHSSIFNNPDDLIIINGNIIQILKYQNEFYLIKSEDIHQLAIDSSKILFDPFILSGTNNFTIDIQDDVSVLSQLVSIIPAIYRLNFDLYYDFNQVDKNGQVVSYGTGVTTQIFYMLATELDHIFKTKFEGVDLDQCIKLGKMLYFCRQEGGENFYHIHPYFFLKLFDLSNLSNHIILLKHFKGSDYSLYYNQYMTYRENPKILSEIDPDLHTVDDYLTYILTSDLTQNQIACYNKFIDGYNYFATRNPYHNFCLKLPVSCLIENLICTKNFMADLIYCITDGITDDYCQIFQKLFDCLTTDEKMIFCQNVTGSPYYSDNIYIYFVSNLDDNIREVIYDETVLGENDYIETIEIEISAEPDNTILYQISTCESTLTVFCKPTTESIKNVLDMLIIEDLKLKN